MTKLGASVRCTKISAEFEFGSHSPLGAHPSKMWRSATTLGKSALVVYLIVIFFYTLLYIIHCNCDYT